MRDALLEEADVELTLCGRCRRVGIFARRHAQPLAPARGRQRLYQHVGRRLAQLARGDAVVVEHDLVADGKRTALHDARRFQCLGIGPHCVVVEAADDEGNVGDHAVEDLPGDGLAEGLMCNAGRQQHRLARPLLAEQRDGLSHRRESAHAVQHQRLEFHGAAEQVHVALDDAGHHRLLRGIDHPRVPGLQALHI